MTARLPIRARIAAGYAAVLIALLGALAAFLYSYVSGQLDESLRTGLQVRSRDLAAIVVAGTRFDGYTQGGGVEEGFSQVIGADGRFLVNTRPAPHSRRPVLTAAELRRLDGFEPRYFEREVQGIEGELLILAQRTQGDVTIIAGASTDDRDEAVSVLASALAIGAPVAILLASLAGYLLAGRSLRPVAAMRERAEEITLARDGERLPLPAARDEIHDLGSTLNAMLERIEAAVERERRFVADASHELRTPLANLSAELELARRPGRERDELSGAIESAAEDVDRLSRLAEDLLVIARSDRGELPLALEPTELGQLLERTAGRFRARAGDRGLEVAADAGLTAEVDPRRIEQAVGNLIDNSLRHGAGEIRVEARRSGDRIEVSVSDQGPGFGDDFRAHAFERFTRADEGRTGDGAGLGLAIVAAIASAHGGAASIDAGGHGGRVTIMLPAL